MEHRADGGARLRRLAHQLGHGGPVGDIGGDDPYRSAGGGQLGQQFPRAGRLRTPAGDEQEGAAAQPRDPARDMTAQRTGAPGDHHGAGWRPVGGRLDRPVRLDQAAYGHPVGPQAKVVLAGVRGEQPGQAVELGPYTGRGQIDQAAPAVREFQGGRPARAPHGGRVKRVVGLMGQAPHRGVHTGVGECLQHGDEDVRVGGEEQHTVRVGGGVCDVGQPCCETGAVQGGVEVDGERVRGQVAGPGDVRRRWREDDPGAGEPVGTRRVGQQPPGDLVTEAVEVFVRPCRQQGGVGRPQHQFPDSEDRVPGAGGRVQAKGLGAGPQTYAHFAGAGECTVARPKANGSRTC